MVAYQGAKMSKSLGNLVFVSRLRAAGVDPMAIRLALVAHHYRSDWEWTDDVLAEAQARLDRWRAAVAPAGTAPVPDGRGAAGAGSGRPRRSWRRSASGSPTTWTPPGRSPRSTRGPTRRWPARAASLPDADLVRDTVDALLGVNL